jgi:hypothetical protein
VKTILVHPRILPQAQLEHASMDIRRT